MLTDHLMDRQCVQVMGEVSGHYFTEFGFGFHTSYCRLIRWSSQLSNWLSIGLVNTNIMTAELWCQGIFALLLCFKTRDKGHFGLFGVPLRKFAERRIRCVSRRGSQWGVACPPGITTIPIVPPRHHLTSSINTNLRPFLSTFDRKVKSRETIKCYYIQPHIQNVIKSTTTFCNTFLFVRHQLQGERCKTAKAPK